MPTRKSLNDSWYAQFELGLSDEQYYCQDHNPNYNPPKDNRVKLTGEKLGEVVYDPKTQRLTIDLKIKKD
ncbi:MAG: hypothetical protein PHV68_10615 [Candidatus Gastranaerophilales bacterium]|nr:hypothetical protein [Candidatus Gastranaerophilales bacterium]